MRTRSRVVCLGLAAASACLASAAAASADVAVYQFTAVVDRIIDAAGGIRSIPQIPPGSVITGRFTYALNQSPSSSSGNIASYNGACNALEFGVNGLNFYGPAGQPALVQLSSFAPYSETFLITYQDLTMPPGWSINHTSDRDSYLFVLQNVPPTGVVGNLSLPTNLSLSQFTTYREFRMDFGDGLTFPGGQFTDRTTVLCLVQSVTQLSNISITSTPGLMQAPSSRTVAAGQNVTIPLEVNGIGTSAPSFQWRRNGLPISIGGRISISASGALTISSSTIADEGVYDCLIDYGCGSMLVGPVAFGVYPCPADFNRSGQLAADDIFDFLNAWFAGCP